MADGIQVDMSSFAKFGRTLRKAEPEIAKELNAGLKLAGDIVATNMRDRTSWSTRIPGSVRVLRAGVRVKVRAGGAKAPGAKPINHGGMDGTFRHPIFGSWGPFGPSKKGGDPRDQQARPFSRQAVEAAGPVAARIAQKAVDRAVRRAGFK